METDSLGSRPVPNEALYGIQTARALENFPISGDRARPSLITAYGWLKWAAAKANEELGILTPKVAGAIQQAAEEVAEHRWDGQFVVDVYQAGAGVSFHMNVNEVIANRAAEILGGERGRYDRVHPNDHVNYGQSTNDTYPTALRMAARFELDRLLPVLRDLAVALHGKAVEFDDVLTAGRTHLQDALPIRLGQKFAGYSATLQAAAREVEHAADGLLELGLGGTAVGTGVNRHPRFPALTLRHLSQRTGHRWRPAPDLRAAMQSQLPISVASSALRNLALELIRIANDLRLMSSGPMTGLNEIELPALQPGSSIMPGKVNPVLPEMMAMVGFQVVGNDVAAALAVQAGQLELNVMMPAMSHAVLTSSGILTEAMHVFSERCIRGLKANRERCKQYAASTLSLATVLNPYLGYARVAQLVKQALAEGRTIVDLAREQQLLPEAELAALLDPRASTEPRAPRKTPRPASAPRSAPTRRARR